MIETANFHSSLYHPKHWPLWAGVSLLRLTTALPLRWQMKLGGSLGRIAMRFAKSRVHTAQRNLELCFPHMPAQERQALLEKNFEQTGKAIFDSLNAWFWSDHKVQQHMRLEGQTHVEQAIKDGYGVILFATHCLPLEMGARIFGQFQPGIGVYRPHNNPVMEYLQVKGRLRSNKALVPKRDVRQMIRCLRQQEVIWYTADQDFGRSSAVFIPFFAVPDAATITGGSALAKLGKAKVLPFFVARNDDDSGYHIQIDPPLEHYPSGDDEQDARVGNQMIEQLISRCPEQYMWLHRRFKTRPEKGMPSLYADSNPLAQAYQGSLKT